MIKKLKQSSKFAVRVRAHYFPLCLSPLALQEKNEPVSYLMRFSYY
jgi:hypothetical protein